MYKSICRDLIHHGYTHIPYAMSPGGYGTASGESLSEDDEVGHLGKVKAPPIWKSSFATLTFRLVTEDLLHSVCNAVYMRFDDSGEVIVIKLYQSFIFDSFKYQVFHMTPFHS